MSDFIHQDDEVRISPINRKKLERSKKNQFKIEVYF